MGRGTLHVHAYVLTVQDEGDGLCMGDTVCPEHSRGTGMFGGHKGRGSTTSQRPEGKKTSQLRDVKCWTCIQEGGVLLGIGRKAAQV